MLLLIHEDERVFKYDSAFFVVRWRLLFLLIMNSSIGYTIFWVGRSFYRASIHWSLVTESALLNCEWTNLMSVIVLFVYASLIDAILTVYLPSVIRFDLGMKSNIYLEWGQVIICIWLRCRISISCFVKKTWSYHSTRTRASPAILDQVTLVDLNDGKWIMEHFQASSSRQMIHTI